MPFSFQVYKRLWWNWEPDTILYPGWSNLVKFFKDINIKTLAYVNPFLSDVSSKPGFIKNYFKEAEEKGFLVKRKSDKSTYIINSGSSSFSAGLIDLANPSAFEWYKSVLKQHLLSDEYGVDGYMADFAETLPFDSYINDGATDPSEFHNSYAVEWARLNHELVGDSAVVPFHRSAFTTSPKYAKAFWEGDQLPTWDREDGL